MDSKLVHCALAQEQYDVDGFKPNYLYTVYHREASVFLYHFFTLQLFDLISDLDQQ
jgi:hypothetical protein